MADGTEKPIENVEVGDKVQATDPVSGRTEAKPVTALIAGEGAKNLVRVTVDTDGSQGNASGVVTATSEHPSWSPADGAWVYAAQLHAGTWLQTGDGTWVQVSAVEKWTAAQHVHNLSVDGIPTYYVGVGRASVLVHNTPCPDDANGVDHALDRHGHDSYGKSDDGVWDEDMDEDALGELARRTAGRIGKYQKSHGTIIYYVDAGRIIGRSKRSGGRLSTGYAVVRDKQGRLVTMYRV
ncbi:polymorphic toxin-type HINT domain-containing protein [Nonomuraea wenchangensis]